jgi:hypothetical protein
MKSFIITGIFAASLALAAKAAMAATPADPYPQGVQFSRVQVAARGAARTPQPHGQLNVDVARFIQGMLGGGPVPYANLIRDVRSMQGGTSGGYSPSYDYSTAAADNSASDAAAAQAALDADAETQTINELNDINAQTASMAAAEEENDDANAAALQTEINAGM